MNLSRYFLCGRFLSYDSHGATPSHHPAEAAVGRSRGADIFSGWFTTESPWKNHEDPWRKWRPLITTMNSEIWSKNITDVATSYKVENAFKDQLIPPRNRDALPFGKGQHLHAGEAAHHAFQWACCPARAVRGGDLGRKLAVKQPNIWFLPA